MAEYDAIVRELQPTQLMVIGKRHPCNSGSVFNPGQISMLRGVDRVTLSPRLSNSSLTR